MDDNKLITVEKLNNILQRLIDNGNGDFVLQIGDDVIHDDSIGIYYSERKIKIRGQLYHREDLQAISNLRSKIDKAYEEFHIERTQN